jgi:hypothetical protein
MKPAWDNDTATSETVYRPDPSPEARGDMTELKLEINRLIWQYSPEETTIGAADELACKILVSILKGKYAI